MYKHLIKNLEKKEETFSEEEAIKIVRDFILQKFENNDLDEEELKKGIRQALATGLSVLGLIHGAHYMSPENKPQQPSQFAEKPSSDDLAYRQYRKFGTKYDPQQFDIGAYEAKNPGQKQEMDQYIASKQNPSNPRNIASETGDTASETGDIDNFLSHISMIESSGGKNTSHKKMKSGIHKGDSAYGKYGLMPNTIREIAVRMGKKSPLYQYSKMGSKNIKESFKKNPQHEKEMATYLANHLNQKFGGDKEKMAFSWNQGHNMPSDHEKFASGEYKNHDYVKKYQLHSGQNQQKEDNQPKRDIAMNK